MARGISKTYRWYKNNLQPKGWGKAVVLLSDDLRGNWQIITGVRLELYRQRASIYALNKVFNAIIRKQRGQGLPDPTRTTFAPPSWEGGYPLSYPEQKLQYSHPLYTCWVILCIQVQGGLCLVARGNVGPSLQNGSVGQIGGLKGHLCVGAILWEII